MTETFAIGSAGAASPFREEALTEPEDFAPPVEPEAPPPGEDLLETTEESYATSGGGGPRRAAGGRRSSRASRPSPCRPPGSGTRSTDRLAGSARSTAWSCTPRAAACRASAKDKRIYHTVRAVDYYSQSHGCHYVNGWRGVAGGDLLQVANEREQANGVGVGDQRRSIDQGRFEKDLPAAVVAQWRARWPGVEHPLRLLPGTRTANSCYVHVECVPCVFHHSKRLVTDADADAAGAALHPGAARGGRAARLRHCPAQRLAAAGDVVAHPQAARARGPDAVQPPRQGGRLGPRRDAGRAVLRLGLRLPDDRARVPGAGAGPGPCRPAPLVALLRGRGQALRQRPIRRVVDRRARRAGAGGAGPEDEQEDEQPAGLSLVQRKEWEQEDPETFTTEEPEGPYDEAAYEETHPVDQGENVLLEPLRVALAVARGERDENKLTNAVFFARYPEWAGRAIAKGDTDAAAEWKDIRDKIVRPLLARTVLRSGSRYNRAGALAYARKYWLRPCDDQFVALGSASGRTHTRVPPGTVFKHEFGADGRSSWREHALLPDGSQIPFEHLDDYARTSSRAVSESVLESRVVALS